MEPEKILDAYIQDYLVKKKYKSTSKTFKAEAAVSSNIKVIDTPDGFLYEWWQVFWEIYIARYKAQGQNVLTHNEDKFVQEKVMHQQWQQNFLQHMQYQDLLQRKIKEQQLQLQRQLQIQQQMPLHMQHEQLLMRQQRQLQMQQLEQLQAQQQRQLQLQQGREDNQSQCGSANDPCVREEQVLKFSTTKMSQKGFKVPVPNDPLHDGDLKSKSVDGTNSDHTTTLRSPAGKSSYTPHAASGGISSYMKNGVDASRSKASKNITGQKRKARLSSSSPVNSSVNTSTIGTSPCSVPSTPQSHTMGDMLPTTNLPDKQEFSQPSSTPANSGGGTPLSAANQLAQMYGFIDDPSLDDTVDAYLSPDDATYVAYTGEGFTFSEIGSINVNQVHRCHLSLDGKLLVTSGMDKKANVWCTGSLGQKCMLEEHSEEITDARFSSTMPWVATSSLDKTIRVWDVDNPEYSLRTFVGHSASVMSLDFHHNEDLICSCDGINEIRYWSVKAGGCARVSKGGATEVRFQPRFNRYLAASVGNGILIMDIETGKTCGNQLQGHALKVQSICWDFSGELLASASEDLVRVWKIGSGAQWDCIHELSFPDKKFGCCVFHPHYPSLLMIGCSKSLDLWNMAENKMMSPLREPVSALAVSEMSGLVASASLEKDVRMWKWV